MPEVKDTIRVIFKNGKFKGQPVIINSTSFDSAKHELFVVGKVLKTKEAKPEPKPEKDESNDEDPAEKEKTEAKPNARPRFERPLKPNKNTDAAG